MPTHPKHPPPPPTKSMGNVARNIDEIGKLSKEILLKVKEVIDEITSKD